MTKPFPRKEIYVFTTEKPINEKNVYAINDKDLIISDYLKDYSEKRWESDNKEWASSVIPSALEVELSDNELKIHCGLTEYKYLLGMVKLADETKQSPSENIHGLSIETVPIFADDTVIFEQRLSSSTQHGVEFYDFPTASQNAEIYIKKAEEKFPGLVKSMFDMSGFPKFHILRAFEQIKPESLEIISIKYTGFSRGFEVSLDSQFNGYTFLLKESKEVMKGDKAEHRLVYRKKDLLDVLNSIGNTKLKEDIYGKKPGIAPQTGAFTIVDCCLGNILSTLYHLDNSKYKDALNILKDKEYEVNEVKPEGNIIKLDSLI